MSENYISHVPKDLQNISGICSCPEKISYSSLYDQNIIKSIPLLFALVKTDTNDNFTQGVLFVLKRLVPEFKASSASDISFVHFQEGITNKIVCVTNLLSNFQVIVRTFGNYTDYLIDRDMELIVMNSSKRIKVYGRFINGIIYSYIKGRTLCIGDLIDISTFNQTAAAIARHHKLTPPIKKVPILFITLRKWLCNVPLEYVDPRKKPFDIKILKEELIFLEENLSKRSDIVLCHNDLLLKNFIKNESEIELIDFEYSGYNYRAFDIVNHFNEWCGFDLNWDNFPNEDTQRRFLKAYLNSFYEGEKNINSKDINLEIDGLIEDIKWFDLASNYYWGVWALIQAALSNIDFNYCEYGNERFRRYFEIKKKVVGENKGN